MKTTTLLITVLLLASISCSMLSMERTRKRHRRRTTRRVQAVVAPSTPSTPSTPVAPAAPTAGTVNIGRYTFTYSSSNWTRFVWGGAYLAAGIPLCFFGIMWWGFNAIITGAIGGAFLTDIIMSYAPPQDTTWMYIWLAIKAALIVTFILVFCLSKKFGGALIGAFLGFMLTNLGTNIIVTFTQVELQVWWSLIIMAVLGTAGFFIGCWKEKGMIASGTAILGGYSIVVGVGMMTGQYPVTLNPTGTTWVAWMYIAAAVVLPIIGMIIQCSWVAKKKAEESSNVNVDIEVIR